MKHNLAMILVVAGAIGCAIPSSAQDALFVDITEGEVAPLAIGVPDTRGAVSLDLADGVDAGTALARIVRADIGTDPFFNVVTASSSATADDTTLLRAYAARGTQALVIGRVNRAVDGSLVYSCAFLDVFSGAIEIEREFRVPPAQWRRAAHKCADMVVTHATGYRGHFDTRFAMVTDTVAGQRPTQGVAALDVDGANQVILAATGEPTAMPVFSPDNRRVLYMAYASDEPGLVLVDLVTGRRNRIQLPPGLPSAPQFSPDGQFVVMALSRDGNTDIYEHNLATGQTIRLTDTTGIDTSPSYSPDGSRIVFESDRSGQPQLYVMARDGSDQRRISIRDPHTSPAWSPDGRSIAFATQTAAGTRIGVMAPDGSKRKILTEGPHDEAPTWAPSGRAIGFQRNPADGSPPELRITDLSGRSQYAVAVPSLAAEPDWSEVLP